ncbi:MULTISPECIES: AAA family ATPase [Candidatus Nitrosocaldus]|uniref:Cell division protein C n=1 Tax=Candidatus Nitrosocaldus cavascurensis TaxID=2058097 RepID=A0A2K5ASM3_9ARCH|nr:MULTISPECIES: AAA family ATPase [Candidatus Nitrosocaldus]SPC34641.1 Cell division protein C [Candidatus Nitrosocaldus cavascurensis]
MTLAPQELENIASKHAAEAIKLDSQGAKPHAILHYQKAVDALLKLVHLYPDYKLNKIYVERAKAYQNRIKALQESRGLDGMHDMVNGDKGSSKGSEQANTAISKVRHDSVGGERSNGNGLSSNDTNVEILKADFDDLVLKDKPNVKWDEVIGLDDAKRALRESIIYPTQRPDLFPLGWPKGILLYGPPGNGKTLLAAATASEIEGYFINVDAASMMSKWLGEAEKNVAKLFSMARRVVSKENVPVILFIDEVDSLLGTRSNEIGGEVRVKNQFLTEMDGITSKSGKSPIYVIGATNKPWSLDWPFLRRFQKRIYVGLPDYNARLQMFRSYTAQLNIDPSLKLEDLAKITEGYSASDIRDICQGVQLKVVNELFESGKAFDGNAQTRSIGMNDFKEILKNRKPSVSQEMIKAYLRWTEQFKAL